MRELPTNILISINVVGLVLPVAMLLVVDPESLRGITIGKQFWFILSLVTVATITIVHFFYRMSILDIDIIKTIFLGTMTVVTTDISRSSNKEMMKVKLSLQVIISFFFFKFFFNHNKIKRQMLVPMKSIHEYAHQQAVLA